jgi:hypothetical protein
MTHATEPTFDVPDLDLPAVRRSAPIRPGTAATAAAPITSALSGADTGTEAALPRLELDRTHDHTRRGSPRFVTGSPSRFEPAPVDCSYCGAPRSPYEQECASCGYRGALPPVSRVPSASVLPLAVDGPPPGLLDTGVEALQSVPFGFWKRLTAYALLFMVLGNGCTCRGLALHTNLALVMLIVVGLVGLAASLQRKP